MDYELLFGVFLSGFIVGVCFMASCGFRLMFKAGGRAARRDIERHGPNY